MGDDFIEKKNQRFKHQADKVHSEEFGSVSVFDAAPEEEIKLVRFRCPGPSPATGDIVALLDIPGKDKVRAMLGTSVIGEVDSPGSALVREILSNHPTLHGMLPAKVVNEKDLAGYCKAQIRTP